MGTSVGATGRPVLVGMPPVPTAVEESVAEGLLGMTLRVGAVQGVTGSSDLVTMSSAVEVGAGGQALQVMVDMPLGAEAASTAQMAAL